ncbi:MAG: HlyD family efflux transporter periplasmic adaptor subunit, partial [Alphaproteobacteria bacterium]|nr:HlyD family efflux transporter periplasmic adaptor subunit [Alphaproteobacteria bacterium]
MGEVSRAWLFRGVIIIAIAGLAVLGWRIFQPESLGDGFIGSNGRIEAVEINVATKAPGRIKDVLVNEGEYVQAGQILAVMDTVALEAMRREAEAQLQRAHIGVETAQIQVTQREAEKAKALAIAAQREAELNAAKKRLDRSEELVTGNNISRQQLDDNLARFQGAQAAVSAANAQIAAADAAIATGKSQVIGARSMVDAAQATLQRIEADIDDSVLKSPRDGRVQYRIAQPGEVVGAGGKVLNLVDLSDVYMIFFLPTEEAGRISLGGEVRLVLDAAPQYVIPARVSYVADVAQFTPKTVETALERQKLMFR